MDFQIDIWLNNILEKLKNKFGERLLFVGLQGSYNRGEASADSDIDVVVILDELRFEDLKAYKKIVENMPYKEKACGFVSGKAELQNWSKHDTFQFFYDTKPLLGKLSDIINPPSVSDVKLSLKFSAEMLYHSAVHSFLFADNPEVQLAYLYKTAFFILQAKYFVENNTYIQTKKELLPLLKGIDKEILEICADISKPEYETESLYSKLIFWCRDII